MGIVKFTDKRRETFLQGVRDLGRVNQAARAAGVSPQTVRNHRDDDRDFDALVAEALEDYAEKVRSEVYRRAIEGVPTMKFHQGLPVMKPVMDEAGNEYVDEDGKPLMEIYVERQYSDRLLELEAKRVDPAYRDKSTVDMNVKGGVLVVPAPMSADEWEGNTIEHEAKK